jgi:2-phosphosulfolactate phosphatase
MKVKILEFVAGAEEATGVAVIIDVFRAFSTACYAYDSGASRLVVTDSAEKAFKLKKEYRNSVLVGEKDEMKIEGFDFGNSPTELLKADLSGKIVVQTTTAGTRGLLSALNAEIVLSGSLVNSGAIIRYLRKLNPSTISLVAMGYRGIVSSDEDLLCAEIIKSGLEGNERSYQQQISKLSSGSGARFFNPANIDFSPPTDFFLCTMMNRFDFILRGERRFDSNIDLARIDV